VRPSLPCGTIQEPAAAYNALFDGKMGILSPKNGCFGDKYPTNSGCWLGPTPRHAAHG